MAVEGRPSTRQNASAVLRGCSRVGRIKVVSTTVRHWMFLAQAKAVKKVGLRSDNLTFALKTNNTKASCTVRQLWIKNCLSTQVLGEGRVPEL